MKQLQKHLITGIIIILISAFASCDSAQESNDASQSGQTGPGTSQGTLEVTAVSADVTGTGVTLNWADPTAEDVDHIEVACTNDSSLNQTVERGMRCCAIRGLAGGVAYTFRLRGIFADGTESAGIEILVSCGEYDVTETVYFIHTPEELNAVRGGVPGYEDRGLDKNYCLMADLDLSGYSDGSGWVPLGSYENSFTGKFNGNGHVIRNLTINRNRSGQGLFGAVGEQGRIICLKLEDVTITAEASIGGLAGYNYGTIMTCSAQGDVSGTSYVGVLVGSVRQTGVVSLCFVSGTADAITDVGLLAGSNSNIVTNCASRGTVTGMWRQGGLVGCNIRSIDTSFFTGTVSGKCQGTGGLTGGNSGDAEISHCHVVAEVVGEKEQTGGLAGYNYGKISFSAASGTVTGTSEVGGLVGDNNSEGTIENCYASSTVTGAGEATGGLVGFTNFSISRCAASGDVYGNDYTGGLAGYARNGLSECAASGNVTGTGNCAGGLLGYNNGGTISNCSSGLRCVIDGLPAGPDFTQLPPELGINEVVAKCSSAPVPVYTTVVRGSGHSTGGLIGRSWGGVSDCTSSCDVIGAHSTGGLTGSHNSGHVVNCRATGSVRGEGTTGGLIGYCHSRNAIDCFATGDVEGAIKTGGLIGEMAGYLSRCYATGTVKGDDSVGGLVGYYRSISIEMTVPPTEQPSIKDCYARGNVEGGSSIGGLVGYKDYNAVKRCYATGLVKGSGEDVGGLIGYSRSRSKGFHYQLPDNDRGFFVDITEMKSAVFYIDTGWDFAGEDANGVEDVWSICPCTNDGFPYLTGLAP